MSEGFDRVDRAFIILCLICIAVAAFTSMVYLAGIENALNVLAGLK